MTEISCPHCGTSKTISHDKFLQLIGRTARCGSCRFEFQVLPPEPGRSLVLADVDPLDFLASPSSTDPPDTTNQGQKPPVTEAERRRARSEVSRLIRRRRRDQSGAGCSQSAAKIIVIILAALFILGVAAVVGMTSLPALGVIVAGQGIQLLTLWTITDQLGILIQRLDDRDDGLDE